MKQRLFTKTAMASALAAACLSAHALGLGELNVASNLNQRFTGVIPLSEINSEDLETVTVTLAPPDAYDRAGLDRSDFLNSLRFDVRNDGGNPRVVVSSTQIAREPMVNVLVQARWKGGKIIREYAVLLDPPDLPKPKPKPAPVIQAAPALPAPVPLPPTRPVAPAAILAPPMAVPPLPTAAQAKPLPLPEVVQRKPAESEFFETSSEASQPVVRKGRSPAATPIAPVAVTGDAYGPIKPQETLWRVATNIRPSGKVSMEQVMLALVDANPSTIQRGITLAKGSMLKVPTVDSMLRLSPAEAKARLAAIQAGRTRAGSNATAAPAPAAATSTASAPAMAVPAKPVAAPIAVPVPVQPAAPSTAPAAMTPSAAPSGAATPPTTAEPVGTSPAGAPSDSAAATTAVGPEASTANTAPLTPPAAVPPAATPPVVADPFATDDAPGNDLLSYWPLAAGGGLALLFGLLAFSRVRKKPAPMPDRYPPQAAGASPARPTAPSAPSAPPRAAVVTPPSANRAGDTQITTARALAADHAPVSAAPAAAASVAAPMDFDLTRPASVSHDGGEGFEHVAAAAPAVAKTKADPLADADFHLAYGLFDEAEEVLTKAIAREPARADLKLKLAEAFFASGKADAFERISAGLKDRVSGAEWSKIAIMGSQLLPGSSLYQSGAGVAEATDFDLTLDRLPADQSKPLGALSADFAETVPPPNSVTGMPNLARDLSDDVFADVAKAAAVPMISMPSVLDTPSSDADAIDFMLGQSIVPLGMNQLAGSPAAPARDLNKPLEFNLGGTALNVDSPIRPLTLPAEEINSLEISLQSLQVSLTPREQAPASEDEMNTKLDLARAYVEMDDKDSARGLLKEVVEHGSEQHQSEAKALLERLGGQ